METNISIFDIINCILALGSFIISCIALYMSVITKRPYIRLNKIFFEPKDYRFYEGTSISKEKLDIIKYTWDENLVFSKVIMNGVEYLLVNMLPINTRIDDIRLVLVPYQFSYINTGCFVNEVTLKGAVIKLNHEERYRKSTFDYQLTPYKDKEDINIKIAYACKLGDYTSVIYDKLKEMQYFDYQEDVDIARGIINFKKEIYFIECNQAGKKFSVKLVYEMKKNGLKYTPKYSLF